MFSILNNVIWVGNSESPMCNFLAFPAADSSKSVRGLWRGLYLLDGEAFTNRPEMASGLRIAHPNERLHPVRIQTREV